MAKIKVLVVGQRVFGYSQLKRENDVLSAVVPSSALSARTELSIQTVFPARGCRGKAVAIGDAMPASSEKLAVLERGKTVTTFLLSGNKLNTLEILSPKGARLSEIGTDPEKLRILTLTAGHLASNKQVVFMRPGGKLVLVTIPELEPKKPEAPRAQESITVGSDEAFIVGDGLKDVEAVFFRGQPVEFEVVDNNTLRVSKLRTLDLTRSASTHTIVLQFKSRAKTKSLKLVDSKVELTSKG